MIREVVAALLVAPRLISSAHAGPIQLSDFSSQHIEVSLASLPVGMGSVPSITADGITFRPGFGLRTGSSSVRRTRLHPDQHRP